MRRGDPLREEELAGELKEIRDWLEKVEFNIDITFYAKLYNAAVERLVKARGASGAEKHALLYECKALVDLLNALREDDDVITRSSVLAARGWRYRGELLPL